MPLADEISIDVLSKLLAYTCRILQSVKVEAAKRTLGKGKKSIFEVMNEVGYSDDKTFREAFKKITGLSPLDYKSRYNKETVLA